MGYTIEIENLETVAYLKATLGTVARSLLEGMTEEASGRFDGRFPGGISRAIELASGPIGEGQSDIWEQLGRILTGAGITDEKAPWLKPQAPTKIDGHPIDYRGRDGIKFGCNNQYRLSLDDMELMVEKCKAAT